MFDFIPLPILAGCGIAALAIAAFVVLSRFLDDLTRFIRATPLWHLALILVLVGRMVLFGGSKTNDVGGVTGDAGGTNAVEIVEGGTNGVDVIEGTNGVEIAEGETNGVDNADGEPGSRPLLLGFAPPLLQSESDSASTLLPDDSPVPCDYKLVGVTTNEDYSYEMPPNGTLRGTWHLTGAYEAIQKVGLEGFEFPLGSDLLTCLWSFTCGKVRTRFTQPSNEIAIVGAPMSAVPDVSRFWTAATSDDTYLLTWEDFALGRQSLTTNNQQLTTLSAQLELFRNGNFIARSNGVERLYSRVVPGVETEGYGPHQDEAVEENTDAYYTIDLVVSNADARVVFIGDGPSNLPDPNFIARANETNTVELLIGKTYEIKCDLPFKVVDSSDWRVDVWQRSPKAATVVWPVEIYMDYGYSLMSGLLQAPRLGSPSGGPRLRVDPDWLNGTVSMPTNVCCGVSGTGGEFQFACGNGDCGCGGCEISGSYTYEGYTITFGGWECGCVPHEDEPDDLSEWGLSVPEVVFKDGALRELSVWFDPGEDDDNSGNLVLTQTQGQGKVRLWANERKTSIASRFSWPVADGVGCTYYVEGVETSDSVEDIEFKLEWVKDDGPDPEFQQMTCAEVEEVRVSGNKCGASRNPPPFTGQEPHDFDVTHSPSPDQHAVVFFKDVVNESDFTVDPFDIYIDLQLKPTGAPVGRADWFTLRPTPSSGSLSSVSSTRGCLSNPSEGGVYHIGAAFDGSPTNECIVVLPLAGAEMEGVLRSDIAKADGFVSRSKANWPRRWYSRAIFASKWFSFDKYGFYRGRPDNANKPTVWCYNQVRDDDGKGAVGTLFGVPIHIEKLSNLLAAYACERLKVPLEEQGIAQVIGTDNDPSADLSWTIGTRLAQTGAFNREVGYLATNAYQWASEKCRKLWPNRNAVDNHRDSFGHGDFNVEFSSPGFIYCEQ